MGRMTLAARLDEMIVLYTVSGMTVRQIADRFEASAQTVKIMLAGAGVSLKGRASPAPNAKAGAYERRPPVPRSPSTEAARAIVRLDLEHVADLGEANRLHVRAVVRALGGKGFPFLTFRSAA